MKKQVRSIPKPKEIKKQIPLDKKTKNKLQNQKTTIKNIISGKSNKKLAIIGPCSIDFKDNALKYANFLSELQKQVKDHIIIVMRFYTSKPRTTVGRKGIINKLPTDQETNFVKQIKYTRQLAIKCIQSGIPIADEMLYPQLIEYFDDIYSYMAVGARSTENQFHRETASGLNIPVGAKNPSSGNIETMINTIISIQHSHRYISNYNSYKTKGNPYAHGILRGSYKNGPNYSKTHLKKYLKLSQKINHQNGVIIDTNHGNSNKSHLKQNKIMTEITTKILPELRKENININSIFKGLLVESYLKDGNQNISPNYEEGKSFTDPCIGKAKTTKFIKDFYKNIKKLNE